MDGFWFAKEEVTGSFTIQQNKEQQLLLGAPAWTCFQKLRSRS
ncbi:MAG TPA: hypothetical protein VGZ25_05865 [Gemmataceae bacterium]|nr:hypothetical protein [Gemmataceae bacterium]